MHTTQSSKKKYPKSHKRDSSITTAHLCTPTPTKIIGLLLQRHDHSINLITNRTVFSAHNSSRWTMVPPAGCGIAFNRFAILLSQIRVVLTQTGKLRLDRRVGNVPPQLLCLR